MLRVFIVLLSFAVLTTSAGAAAAAHAVKIPFTLVDDRIVVEASVNGQPGFAMIVDTGSTGLILTPQTASRLNVQQRPGPTIDGAGALSRRTNRVTVSSLQLAGYAAAAKTALVVDLDVIRRAFHFPRLDGVIGYDLLGGRFVGIDWQAREITVATEPLPTSNGATTTAYTVDNGLLVVEGSIDGVHGPMVVDTGDRSAFTVFQRFARANGFYDLQKRERDVVTGIGIGGEIHSDVFQSTIGVFGTAVSAVRTRAPLRAAGVFSSSDQLGSIGDVLLERFHLIFDGAAKTITAWPIANAMTVAAEPLAKPDVLARHATFGAVLAKDPRGTLISRVLPGGAAEHAGLANGDVATALAENTTPTVASFLAEIHRHHAGEHIRIELLRKDVPLQRDVVLGGAPDEREAGLTTTYETIAVDGTVRRTIITTPQGAAQHLPAMLIMGGIGCYSVDVAATSSDAYLRLAHDVSRAGYVTMRVEKSGVGDSEGPPCQRVDFDAEQRAYAIALETLRRDSRVDSSRIYLFGHSIGTLEAPLLANQQPVAGIVVAEAVGRDWAEYEVRNLRRQLELGGDPPATVDAALTGKQACLVRLLIERQPEALIEQTEPDCRVHNGVYPVDAPYMQQVAAINIIGEWARVAVPVLAIYGTSDFVTEHLDHERIVAVVNAAHPLSATLAQIDGMDHLLDIASTPKAALAAFSSGEPRQYDHALSAVVIRWLQSPASLKRS